MKTSRILSMILALALVLAMALPMTASAAGENATLTLTAPTSFVLTASDFTAYKLFNVSVSGTAPDLNYAYTPVSEVAAFITANPQFGPDLKAYLEGTPDMDAFNRAITGYSGFTAKAAASASANQVTFTGLDYGYYLIVGQGELNGEDVVTYSNLLTIDKASNSTILKVDAPEITKKVWNHNPTAAWTTWTDVNIGDIVDFQLTSSVPVMTGYDSYKFTVHDQMSDNLTFDESSVEVTIGGNEYTHFTVETDNVDPDTFQIVFDPAKFIELNSLVNRAIVITYSAELNGEAVIGAPGNPNTAYLEYSNSPYNTNSTGDTPPSTVIVYTFDIEIYKYTGDLQADEDYPLGDAKFELRDSTNTPVQVVELDENGDPVLVADMEEDGYVHSGNYRLATSDDEAEYVTTILVSADDGKIYIKGLDAGEYVLEETQAPIGYNLLPGWKTIVVIHEDAAGGYSMTVDADPTNVVNVQNNSGNSLPGTGGMGTTVFYVAGAILATLLGVAFVIIRRRNVLGKLTK